MIVLFFNLLATFFLTGLIWTVQVVIYPGFAELPERGFERHHRKHMQRITPVVFPLMVTELLTGLWLAVFPVEEGYGRALALTGLSLILATWLSTAFLQVPLHRRLLGKGRDAAILAALVQTNWIRTAAWSAKSLLGAWVVWVLC